MRSERTLAALLLALATLAAPASGCATEPMKLEEMNSRACRNPLDALRYFLTAVRVRDYGEVWRTLSPATQEEWRKSITEVLFPALFPDFTVGDLYGDQKPPEGYADVKVVDVIHAAEIMYVEPDEDHPSTVMWVQFLAKVGTLKPLPTRDTRVPIVRLPASGPGRPARWAIGLREWAERRGR